MTKVTHDEFFKALRSEEAKGKDIMPRIVNDRWPYTSEWRNQKSGGRELFGVTKCLPLPAVGGNDYFLVSQESTT